MTVSAAKDHRRAYMQIRPNLQKQCKQVAFKRIALNLVTWMLLNEVLRRSIR